MVHCFLGAVGVVDQEFVAEGVEVPLDVGESEACFGGDDYFGGVVASDLLADEVARNGVSHYL